MEENITIKIDKNGKIFMDFDSYSGGKCLEELNKIAEAMSAKIEKKDEKLELYEEQLKINLVNKIEIR
ncbi:MAG: hypothetical protein KA885_02480 [Spirochaetes bacterium]|nr:hypothetical protein [Spirochaetota bacterium]